MESNAGYDEDKVTTGSRQEAVRAREREGGAGSGRGCAMYPPGNWPMALQIHRVLLLTTKNCKLCLTKGLSNQSADLKLFM